jgi:hypothetical protein
MVLLSPAKKSQHRSYLLIAPSYLFRVARDEVLTVLRVKCYFAAV